MVNISQKIIIKMNSVKNSKTLRIRFSDFSTTKRIEELVTKFELCTFKIVIQLFSNFINLFSL